jgi:hypothetical protein
MMPTVVPRFPPITAADLDLLERQLGLPLPAPYSAFLLRHNGGRPMPNTIRIDGLDGNEADVHTIYGLGAGPGTDGDSILWNLEVLREQGLPTGLLPIAYDSFGGPYCLVLLQGTVGYDLGNVLFIEREQHDPAQAFLAAKDFDEFLNSLYEYEEAEG